MTTNDIRVAPQAAVGVPQEAMQAVMQQSVSSAPAKKLRIGRNDLCSCASGKKFKRCCPAVA
jgi:uncharacterized protein YecA (UPF0149 family)